MKKNLLALLMISALLLCSCNEKKVDTTGTNSSETAMDNFLGKLEDGNYVMEVEDYLTTVVTSRDQVTFRYADSLYHDFAVLSRDDETFQILLDEPEAATYLGEGQAIDAASVRLPNSWLAYGNIWDLFYNDPEDPLHFTSYSDTVKQSMLTFAGYNNNALRLMHEVDLVLDKEDPKTARLSAKVNDDVVAQIDYDDIEVLITFGDAPSNAVADAWLKDPVYPAARSGWTDTDEFIFNSVFLPGYGLEAIPFPDTCSYALMVDQENFLTDDEVVIRDGHATEEDVGNYKQKLLAEGFKEVRDGDRTCFRKLLRPEYDCYSSLSVEYNDGLDLVARKYYDFPVYASLDEINSVIVARGYPALPASDDLGACLGTDRAHEMSESWLYFFDYDLGLYVDIDFKDQAAMEAYLDSYTAGLLEQGFTAISEDDEISRYESADGSADFRYIYPEENKVSLLFKAERYYAPEEVSQLIKAAGFPEVSLSEPLSCKDLKRFQKVQYGRDRLAHITVSQEFADAAEAEAFLEALEASLNAQSFDRTNPANVGSNKQIVIANEDAGKYVGIDYFPDQASVNLEFVAD